MAYSNYLLFNNIFLKNLSPSDEELAAARYLVHESARDWYRSSDFSSPQTIVNTWIRPLLNQQTLDLVDPELSDPSAWYLVAPWERNNPLALLYVVGARQKLDGLAPDGTLPKGQHWMIQAVNLALRKPELKLRWVILTNGDQWRLLDASSLRRYEAFLEIDLVNLLKGQDDPLAAYLFHHIVHLEDSLERDETSDANKLDHFVEQSIQATEETEKYLKSSVSDNLNIPGEGDGIMAQLCMGLVNAIDPDGKKAFTESERGEIYRNATYLLYRLLFIFYAEARNMLPMEREDYRAISLNRLVEEAKFIHLNPGKDPGSQTRLWDQLNSLFNAIQYSDEYMGIPPYNGGLFENEGKAYLDRYKIANQFLSEALVGLAYLPDPDDETRVERIDYRDLSVRHLGCLYEGMIEYRLFIAEEKLLARRDKEGKVKYIRAAEAEQKPNDEVLLKGKVYFAQSPHERKATGTHYTAEDLVERLVKQTVLRLLNERWQEFEPKLHKWLGEIDATPGETQRLRLQARVDSELEQFVESQVLSPRVCDPAMGSGHFLVHIAHQITNFILWALAQTDWPNPSIDLNADTWRKRIVENCLYGVDLNQMAVELAKLSLWLATMQLGQPLSFLDHHIKQGNSLLGASLEEIDALLKQDDFSQPTAKSAVAEAKGQYLLLQKVRSLQEKIGEANTLLQKIASQIVNRADDVHQQEFDYEEVEKILAPYKHIGDLIVAQKMGLKIPAKEILSLAKAYEDGIPLHDTQSSWQAKVKAMLLDMHPLHWGLEFPLIFWSTKERGFNIIIGNPPFLGGHKIKKEIGAGIKNFIVDEYGEFGGQTDLSSFFFRLGYNHLVKDGRLGMVATNTIGQGDTRLVGLKHIVANNGSIAYADRYVKWRGDANVEVNLVGIIKFSKKRSLECYLDGDKVSYISSFLDDLPEYSPSLLSQNKGCGFRGQSIGGEGFFITQDERIILINNDPKNDECLKPYLNGDDLNSRTDLSASRWAICFKTSDYSDVMKFPSLLEILEQRVKPYRQKSSSKRERNFWWLFARSGEKLYAAIGNKPKVLVRSRVSELHMLGLVPANLIFGDAIVVFTFGDYYHFSLLQSWIHEIWLRRHASTLESRNRYTPTDCFQTFPFPQSPIEIKRKNAEVAGQTFYEFRQEIMQHRKLGLTKTYNLFNNPACQDGDIRQMRELQIDIDRSILACYGWEDVELQHHFYPNDRKKIRFMLSPSAQREIFSRLITLNQQIAAQEAVQGLTVTADEEEELEDESEA